MYPQRSVMTCGLATALEPPHFNPRTRVGCDRRPCAGQGHGHAVSIHAPAWGATLSCKYPSPKGAGFNPRTRVGCDPQCLHRPQGAQKFQSTHPRGVRHLYKIECSGCSKVSIHAPAWGATRCRLWPPQSRRNVSIHAPAWGATALLRGELPGLCGFNPRTRVGCDVIQRTGAVFHALVSIHAPAWGATCCSCCPGQLVCCFNPRTRVGCDGATRRKREVLCRFQSTHPRGVRH